MNKNKTQSFFIRPLAFGLLLLLLSPFLLAEEIVEKASPLNIEFSTSWIFTAAILVFFMQAGFATLEGGMVRAKNTINVLMKNYTDMCLGILLFWMVGYGVMFGTNSTGWFGMDHFFLTPTHIDEYAFLFFQTMFAATAVTIISGALAERIRYHAYILITVLVVLIIYPIYGSWVWGSVYSGEGWLKALGFVDFAGATVVHSIGAWCALAGIMATGSRLGRFSREGRAREIPGHNLTLVGLSGFILWFGWFGFNGGSVFSNEDVLGQVLLNTHLSAAAGSLGAILTMAFTGPRKIYMTRTIMGTIGGLVAITAGAHVMIPAFAILTGFIAGIIVIIGWSFLERLHLDDAVGVVPVHGFAGVWGTLAVGLFQQGHLFDLKVFWVQLVGVSVAFLWAFPMALLMFKIIDALVGLRADTTHEQRGLDYSEHSEVGYPEFQQNQLHQGLFKE